jgi:hypothetical protein
VKCKILYKAGCLQLIISACYSWEMALNVALDVSFDNIGKENGRKQGTY